MLILCSCIVYKDIKIKMNTFKLNVRCSIKQTNSNVCFRLGDLTVNTNENFSQLKIVSSISNLEQKQNNIYECDFNCFIPNLITK